MSARELIEFVCAGTLPERTLALPVAAAARGKVLSGDPEGSDGAALVDLPGGWETGSGEAAGTGFELLVLSGELLAGGRPLPPESYLAVAAGSTPPRLACAGPASVFLSVSPHVSEDALVTASEAAWSRPQIPGPAPGLSFSVLHGDPAVGPSAFLLRVPAGWEESRTEWHECSEECLILDGDLWHERANGGAGGTMRRHCYFWRPPFVLHSPMGTTGGVSMFMTTDGPLVNHYVEVEGPP